MGVHLITYSKFYRHLKDNKTPCIEHKCHKYIGALGLKDSHYINSLWTFQWQSNSSAAKVIRLYIREFVCIISNYMLDFTLNSNCNILCVQGHQLLNYINRLNSTFKSVSTCTCVWMENENKDGHVFFLCFVASMKCFQCFCHFEVLHPQILLSFTYFCVKIKRLSASSFGKNHQNLLSVFEE